MDLRLKGKKALVTGSSRGIGAAIARRLWEEGASVILNGRDKEGLMSSAAEMAGATYCVSDVTDPDSCESLFSHIKNEHQYLDVLVCNVGSGRSVPPGSETADEWQRMLSINLLSTINTVNALVPLFPEKGGVILCVSSICATDVLGCPVAYAGAKAALDSFVKNSARPFAKKGIRINAISPGNIIFSGSTWEKKLKDNAAGVQAMLEREVALARLGTADEIADFAAYLVSERSSFATGAVFVVDGGQVR